MEFCCAVNMHNEYKILIEADLIQLVVFTNLIHVIQTVN